MSNLNAMINLSKVFNTSVMVGRNVNNDITVSVQYVSYKENRQDIMARSIFGTGSDIEGACCDFLRKAKGRLLFGDNEIFYGKNKPEYICV